MKVSSAGVCRCLICLVHDVISANSSVFNIEHWACHQDVMVFEAQIQDLSTLQHRKRDVPKCTPMRSVCIVEPGQS